MRTKTLLLMILLAFLPSLTSASTSTSSGDDDIPMYVNASTDEVFLITIIEYSSRGKAQADLLGISPLAMANSTDESTDGDFTLTGWSSTDVEGADISEVFIFISESDTMMAVTFATSGSTGYVLTYIGDGTSASAVAVFLEKTIKTGTLAPAPRGFTRKD